MKIYYKCLHDYILNKQLVFKKDKVYFFDGTYIWGDNNTPYYLNEIPFVKDMFLEEIEESSKKETVNHPDHYKWLKDLMGVEPIDICRHLDFNLGNAVKYILRCGKKGEKGYTKDEKTIDDLKKAVFYLNDEIKLIESNENK